MAEAADVGFCATPQKMTEVLKAEGQRSLASGNRKVLFEELEDGTIRNVDKTVGLIFTASKPDNNGISKVGYYIQTDKPIGIPADKMCLSLRIHDVKLYDVRKPVLPAETMIDSTPEAAAKRCDELTAKGVIARENCGFHNDMLKKGTSHGDLVMMQGLGTEKNPDGSHGPNGNVITITAKMAGDKSSGDGVGAILISTLPSGASMLATVFTGTNYTQTALNELQADANVAKSAPRNGSSPASTPLLK
jgi:hypothetical protein